MANFVLPKRDEALKVCVTHGTLTAVALSVAIQHATSDVRSAIAHSDKVFSLLLDPLARSWLVRLNPATETLQWTTTQEFHQEIDGRLFQSARSGANICVVADGSFPSENFLQTLVRRATAGGLSACLLPAVSPIDCLFADLLLEGDQLRWYFTTAFEWLVHEKKRDSSIAIVLHDLSGKRASKVRGFSTGNFLRVLGEILIECYSDEHHATLYEPAPYPLCLPRIDAVPLRAFGEAPITNRTLLYVPPVSDSVPNLEILARLR